MRVTNGGPVEFPKGKDVPEPLRGKLTIGETPKCQ